MKLKDLASFDGVLKNKIKCSYYSDLDESVIEKASSLGMPLIGGTALELIANFYNASGVRKRSNNDLDFLSKSRKEIGELRKWLRENIDPDKVQVDVYTEAPSNYRDYIINIDGVLVMSPIYILWSKLQRWSDKDQQDIKWILSISDLTDDEISQGLDDLKLTKEEIERLESVL